MKAGVLSLLVLVLSLYASYEARQIQIESLTIETEKLPSGISKIRIALISDLHIGLRVSPAKPEAGLKTIRTHSPDLLICAGDLVDGHIPDRQTMARLFRSAADFPLGKFAVIGNHEVYAGLDNSLLFLKESGFTVLRQEIRTLPVGLRIAGIDDEHVSPVVGDKFDFLKKAARDSFTILIRHRPLVEKGPLLIDLQLSGHTHAGQIFPFNFVVARVFSYYSGLYHLTGGSLLYTNRGTGTWGPQMRLWAPPEITIIDLLKK